MSAAAICAALWVLASAATAMLPMRRQYVPGTALLALAPVLILWLWAVHGWLIGVLAVLAFGSMFRNPLIYFWRRARGETPEVPQ